MGGERCKMVANAPCRGCEIQDNNKINWSGGSPRPVPSPPDKEMPALSRSFTCFGRKMGTESKKRQFLFSRSFGERKILSLVTSLTSLKSFWPEAKKMHPDVGAGSVRAGES